MAISSIITSKTAAAVSLAASLVAAAGCRHVEAVEAPDTESDEPIDLEGVDLLLVIDNSISMNQEQAILATDLYSFVGSLIAPLPTSEFDAVDDLRIAVVTSDMGLSYDGQSSNGNWPGDVLPYGCDEPDGLGDNGGFQGIEVASVALANDFVRCDETAAQCPPGWSCAELDADGVGVCHTWGSTEIVCPAQGATWIETSSDEPEASYSVRAACLAMRGIDGCGFEQQLAAAATALSRDDQADFVRDDALLAVIVVSDEEDCSMEDGAALLAEPEIQDFDLQMANIACGNHDEHLLSPSALYERLTDAKDPEALFFAAIVGVPYGDYPGADSCQGFGGELDACLDQEAMQLVEEQPSPPDTTWFFRPACVRSAGEVEVTRAYPGRRYVRLANENFGDMSYVYSICNADWSPALERIGSKVGALLEPR